MLASGAKGRWFESTRAYQIPIDLERFGFVSPATCCWMIGVVVTAVMVSAVELPSGAVVAFAVTEQEAPFLSHVPTLKSSEYFAMFSNAPPTVWYGPHSR